MPPPNGHHLSIAPHVHHGLRLPPLRMYPRHTPAQRKVVLHIRDELPPLLFRRPMGTRLISAATRSPLPRKAQSPHPLYSTPARCTRVPYLRWQEVEVPVALLAQVAIIPNPPVNSWHPLCPTRGVHYRLPHLLRNRCGLLPNLWAAELASARPLAAISLEQGSGTNWSLYSFA